MNISKIHKLSNSIQDVRLVSLSKLKIAAEFHDRDNAGPYLVAQEGYDPQDLSVTPGEFLLNKSGAWLSTEWFLRLPFEQRRAEFFFTRSAEVMQALQGLPPEAVIARPGKQAADSPLADDAKEIQEMILGSRSA